MISCSLFILSIVNILTMFEATAIDGKRYISRLILAVTYEH